MTTRATPKHTCLKRERHKIDAILYDNFITPNAQNADWHVTQGTGTNARVDRELCANHAGFPGQASRGGPGINSCRIKEPSCSTPCQ